MCMYTSCSGAIMVVEEKLIEAVRSFPCLWQTTLKSYRDIKARENAWKAVALQMKYYKTL